MISFKKNGKSRIAFHWIVSGIICALALLLAACSNSQNTGDAQSLNSETSVETPVNSPSYETSADVSYEQTTTEETSSSTSAPEPDSPAFEGIVFTDQVTNDLYTLDPLTGETQLLAEGADLFPEEVFGGPNRFGIPIIMFDEINQVVFVADLSEGTANQGDGGHALFQVTLEDGERTQVTENILPWVSDISPDGTQVVFTQSFECAEFYSCNHIYTMNLDGSDLTQITPEGNHRYGNPTWSPDGLEIGFLQWYEDWSVPNMSSGGNDIFIMGANGQNIRQLTDTGTTVTDTDCGYRGVVKSSFSWSPDGDHIAFISNENLKLHPDGCEGVIGSDELYVMGADGTSIIRLTNDWFVDLYPTWSPDGRFIAVSSGDYLHYEGQQHEPFSIRIITMDNEDQNIVTEYPAINGLMVDWK